MNNSKDGRKTRPQSKSEVGGEKQQGEEEGRRDRILDSTMGKDRKTMEHNGGCMGDEKRGEARKI